MTPEVLPQSFLDDLHDFPPEQQELIGDMIREALCEVIGFCFSGRNEGPRRLQTAIRKFFAVAWLLNPDLLQGEQGERLSLADLAKLPEISCSKAYLSLIAYQFADKHSFVSSVQKNRGSHGSFVSGALVGWAKRRRAKEHVNGNGHEEEP